MEHSFMVDVKVNPQPLWPTMVYSFESLKSVLQEHEKMIVDIRDDFKVTNKGNTFGLFQGRDDLQNLPSFKEFSTFIGQLSAKIFIEEGYENQKIQITNMWANKQGDGSIHPPHSHANSLLSGVYYIKATDKSSGTQFFDPRAQAKTFKPRREKWTINNSSMYEISAITGTGVIFPSWLLHWTPPNTNERISISWNILVRGNYGEPGTLQNANI